MEIEILKRHYKIRIDGQVQNACFIYFLNFGNFGFHIKKYGLNKRFYGAMKNLVPFQKTFNMNDLFTKVEFDTMVEGQL